MKKICLVFASMLLASLSLSAQAVLHEIVKTEDMPNGVNFLPGPPEVGSAAFYADMFRYYDTKKLRDTERGEQAIKDAQLSVEFYLERFGKAMHREMTVDTYPALSSYIYSVYKCARNSIIEAKDHYARVRPYQQFKEPTPIPEDEGPTDYTSYPSGHTVRAWVLALALTAVDPEHQDEILKTGLDMAESRIIAGFHYQSDIDAACLAASAAFARMVAEPLFMELLSAAQAEFRSAVK